MVLVIMEGKYVMGECEKRLNFPNCCAVIDWKHDHIRYPKRVVMNFITFRRATELCLLTTVVKGQISLH